MTNVTETRAPYVEPWTPGTAAIACSDGPTEVPALRHPRCPGLAVTMASFGRFRVTHTGSGLAIGGTYERAGGAVHEMVQWAAIARAYGFTYKVEDSSAVRDCVLHCADRWVPFAEATSTGADGTRPLTVREWVQTVRSNQVGDEFPWEGDSPWDEADALLATFVSAPDSGSPAPASGKEG